MSSLNELLANEQIGKHWKDKITYAAIRLLSRNETREQHRAKHSRSHEQHVVNTVADIDAQMAKLDKQIAGLQKVRNDFAADRESIVQKYNLSGKATPDWTCAYPAFSLMVTAQGRNLRNDTGLLIYNRMMNRQVVYLKSFGKQNKEQHGVGVKNIRVTICANGQNIPQETFTHGWVPNQDKDISKNKSTAYSVEYMDGTSTGWLRWCSCNDATGAAKNASHVLYDLNDYMNHRARAWEAREQCVKSRGSR